MVHGRGVRGTLVVIGNVSDPVPPVDVNALNTGGSLYLTRPTVMHHIRTPEELNDRAAQVRDRITSGMVSVSIGARYPITEVADAFRVLESRSTTGKIVLHH